MWILLLLLTWVAEAAPQELEVWFLTPPSSGQWEHLLAPRLSGQLYAQACEPVGDFCFDKNIGLYPRHAPQTEQKDTKFEVDEGLPQLPTATSVDRSLVSCDAKYAFDIFCGEARPEKKAVASGFEIWIDTSSSLRGIDPSDAKGGCQRGLFVQSILDACGAKRPILKGFDTSLREHSDASGFCASQGLNDAKRLMDWIEESTAKKLILITDVYEYQAELSQFLEAKHAKLRGDRGTFPATQLQGLVSELAKACE